MKKVKVLYLDLDGTVRHGFDELGRFVNDRSDVKVFREAARLIKRYKTAGYRIVAISNQGGIALGHVSRENIEAAMTETNKQCGWLFDKIMWCQHHPQAAAPEFARCWCRKPAIGMIVEACTSMARESSNNECYPPHLALFVGDRPEDKLCAANASIDFMDAKEWRALANQPQTFTIG